MTTRLAILSDTAARVTPYPAWLAGLDVEPWLFTGSAHVESYGGSIPVQGFDDFRTNREVDEAVARVAEDTGLDAIYGRGEFDVERAARLRERLGLPGQTLAEAVLFRDKVAMKARARAAGVPAPDFAAVETPGQLADFAAAHGHRVVLKPRSRSGGVGVQVCRSPAEVAAAAGRGIGEDMMVEALVEGIVHHVDGLVVNGAVVSRFAGRYIGTCLSWQDGGHVGSHTLLDSDPLSARLVAFASTVLAAFPPLPAAPFHLEVFVTPEDDLILCEVACRTGGGGTQTQLDLQWGQHLDRELLRALCRAEPSAVLDPRWGCVGHVLFPPPRGRLLSPPPDPGWWWVLQQLHPGVVGRSYDGPTKSGDHVASYHVGGRDDTEVRARVDQLVSWYHHQPGWGPGGPGDPPELAGRPPPAGPEEGARPRIGAEDAQRLAADALSGAGLADADADAMAGVLVETSLLGVDTHGLRLLPLYVAELSIGRSTARPAFRWHERSPAMHVLDAGDGPGILAALAATDRVVELARQAGIGLVLVKESNHFGAAGVYGRRMARRGMVGVVMTTAAARVAPFGGRDPLLGTNPVCVAARGAGDDLFCLDMATSQISYSAVKHQMRVGEPLAEGWAVDDEGRPCHDPRRFRALSPLGGYKGQGLGMAVEILCGVLLGLPLDDELRHFDDLSALEGRRIGHLVLAIDPGATVGAERFAAGLSQLVSQVRGSPGAGGGTVQVAGDPEAATARERGRLGIPLSENEMAALLELGQRADRSVSAGRAP